MNFFEAKNSLKISKKPSVKHDDIDRWLKDVEGLENDLKALKDAKEKYKKKMDKIKDKSKNKSQIKDEDKKDEKRGEKTDEKSGSTTDKEVLQKDKDDKLD